MIACLDLGLFCVGIPLLLSFLGIGGFWKWKRNRKVCDKLCGCKCHDKLPPYLTK